MGVIDVVERNLPMDIIDIVKVRFKRGLLGCVLICGFLTTLTSFQHSPKRIATRNAPPAIVFQRRSYPDATSMIPTRDIYFYNTLSRKKEMFVPNSKNGRVTFYSCGPTVYDYVHIGNLRSFFTNDLIKRWLRYVGYAVDHVCNLTDVDDKIVAKMAAENISLTTITNKYINAFFEDLDALNMMKASMYPRATDHIDKMIQIIDCLLEKGHAYRSGGSVYFDMTTFSPKHGALYPNQMEIPANENIRYGRLTSGKGREEKKQNSDFALWKSCLRQGELGWESKFGRGRPGWHIECSAMCCMHLGESIDIHSGGVDLVFPHHSNEIVQSESFTGKQLSKYWIHTGFVTVDENKMSKSLGNVITLRTLLKNKSDGAALRYLYCSTQYRKPLNFHYQNFESAQNIVRKLQSTYYELCQVALGGVVPLPDSSRAYEMKEVIETLCSFEDALADDLNTPEALASLHSLIKIARISLDNKANIRLLQDIAFALLRMDTFFGFFYDVPAQFLPINTSYDKDCELKAAALAEKRLKCKRDRNFMMADALRKEIENLGFIINDRTDGYTLMRNHKIV